MILANISQVAVRVWRGLAHRGGVEERGSAMSVKGGRQSQMHCDNSSTRSVDVFSREDHSIHCSSGFTRGRPRILGTSLRRLMLTLVGSGNSARCCRIIRRRWGLMINPCKDDICTMTDSAPAFDIWTDILIFFNIPSNRINNPHTLVSL